VGRPKRLTLVRHAKSDWGDASLGDVDRPLNARGQRDAPEMAARLVTAGLIPTLMVSSPALRAIATARIFAEAFGYPASRIRLNDDAYLASPAELLEVLRKEGGHAAHLMLFGHNPGISQLGTTLAEDDAPGDVPTCAVTSLLLPLSDWRELEPGKARCDYYDFPKNRT